MKQLSWIMLGVLTLILVFISSRASTFSLKTALSPLEVWKVVDLTHPITPTIPIWPGDPTVEIQPWATYAEDGYFINRIAIGEHSGTHWGTPNTFITGASSAEQISVDKLVAPAVVIDIRANASQVEDYQLSVEDIEDWERVYGVILAGSIVILFTGWQDRWSKPEAFINQDDEGVRHWPGFSAAAATFLASSRHVTALGTDTHGIDPGNEETFGASYAIYATGGYVLECLSNLDQLPATGTLLITGGLPIQNGSGSPVRTLALLSST